MGLQVHIDGACEPVNPGGTASYGLVVKDGEVMLYSQSAVVGSGKAMSNNVAEYSALIAFLEWYVNGRTRNDAPVVYSDSRLLVMQMTGRWKAKSGLYVPYYTKATKLIREHRLSVQFRWIPRKQNSQADALSKQVLIDTGFE